MQAASNLGYWIAALMLPVVAPGTPVPFEHQAVLYAASALESFTGGLGTAAFLAFLMAIVRKDRAATEYALLSSVFALSRSVAGFGRRPGRAVDGLRELVPAHVLPRAARRLLLLPWVQSGMLARVGADDGVARGRDAHPDRTQPCPPDPSLVNPEKFSAIAHRDHDYCNPVAAAKIERILDLMPLDAGSRVLDLGCGRAELALRIIERFGSTVVAVERSLVHARRRARARRVDRRAREAAPRRPRHPRLPRRSRDVPPDGDARRGRASTAASPASAATLKGWTKPGGYVLVGEGYWKQKPPHDYLAILGGDASQCLDHRGNVQAGIDAGLVPLHAVDGERRRVGRVRMEVRARDRALRAASSPRTPTCRRCSSACAAGATRTCASGRDTLGFGVYLFWRP